MRDGKLIGHDNDADVAYISRHTHPVDVIRESFRIQRLLHRDGLEISRYSGGAFKVTVRDSEGVPRGLDVFSGFLYDDQLVLLGEIFAPFEESWLRPLGIVELEGRRLPAPADPDRLLAAMYGPSWRVPDPTFKFETDERIRHRLDVWFRGTRTQRNGWDRRYSTSRHKGPLRTPHELARVLHRAEAAETTVVDVGCGRGQDAVWLAKRGHRVFGLDFSGNGYAHLRDRAHEEGWSVEHAELNLLELRHTLAWGARLARVRRTTSAAGPAPPERDDRPRPREPVAAGPDDARRRRPDVRRVPGRPAPGACRVGTSTRWSGTWTPSSSSRRPSRPVPRCSPSRWSSSMSTSAPAAPRTGLRRTPAGW